MLAIRARSNQQSEQSARKIDLFVSGELYEFFHPESMGIGTLPRGDSTACSCTMRQFLAAVVVVLVSNAILCLLFVKRCPQFFLCEF